MQRWAMYGAIGALLVSASASDGLAVQGPPAAPANPPAAIPPLTAPQQAAMLLGRWETCIDLAAQFMAYSALGSRKSVANVERKCAGFEAQLRPVLTRSLTDMMYGSSQGQVAEQTEAAIGSLRRHIHTRATAAVARIRSSNRK